MKNKKNVLDFLSDDKNENLKTPIKYNKNNKRYYYMLFAFIIIIIIIVMGFCMFEIIRKKDNSINRENNNINYEEIINYKIDVTLTNNFLVNTVVNSHFEKPIEKVTFKIPSYYKGITTDIVLIIWMELHVKEIIR